MFLIYGFFIITVLNEATFVFISLAISSLSSDNSLRSVEDVLVFVIISIIDGKMRVLNTGLLMMYLIYLKELLQMISIIFKLKQ